MHAITAQVITVIRVAALVFISLLNIDDNLITSIQTGDFEGLCVLNRMLGAVILTTTGLPHLKTLSLRRNRLAAIQSLDGLRGLSLNRLYLTGNEVTSCVEYSTFAGSELPYIVHE